jgi:hypothetical protein
MLIFPAVATVAMAWNFVLNNQLTYRDRRLKGMAFFYGIILLRNCHVLSRLQPWNFCQRRRGELALSIQLQLHAGGTCRRDSRFGIQLRHVVRFDLAEVTTGAERMRRARRRPFIPMPPASFTASKQQASSSK